jgi:NAD(P)-dependent dehydrogenase (short-subunit alcohol dehydrogenase family)
MGRVDRRKSVQDAKTLITGAASGIGRATALASAARGARLVLTDIDADGLANTVAEIERAGGTVLIAEAFDISDHDAVAEFAATVHERFGSLDVVMNVAGTSVWGTVDSLEIRHWRRMIDINLLGPINVIERFVPPMVRAMAVPASTGCADCRRCCASNWRSTVSRCMW